MGDFIFEETGVLLGSFGDRKSMEQTIKNGTSIVITMEKPWKPRKNYSVP